MRWIVYMLVWLAVTAAAVLIASAAVSSVADRVTDTPTAMLPPTDEVRGGTGPKTPSSERTGSPSLPSREDPSREAAADPVTETTEPVATPVTTTSTTVAPPEPDPTTTTTTPPESTDQSTTATEPSTTEIRSYELVGGSVSVEIGDGTVRIAGASPKPGFTMEIENPGPEKIEIEFHGDEHESQFTGKFENGDWVPSISEEDEHE